ncbi:MAG: reverse transcriptase-like protein [Caldilineaceae bacterium]|nr:reverse transcriptase-like protein [Caldilineaceae bacterium]
MNRTLDQIVNRIGRLAPGKRRVLFRQLKAMGLIEAEDLLSDRDPLRIALSVPRKNIAKSRKRDVSESRPPGPPQPADRPPVSVSAPPDRGRAAADPAERQGSGQTAPSPSQDKAPNDPISIVFDGGSRGNPGEGYGSFALDWPGYPREVIQLTFGDQATNNEAEYDTLIAALDAVLGRMEELQIEPESATLTVWGDSLLVCSQVRGEWACKEPRLQVRLEKVKDLLGNFGEWELNHHPREKSVEILGH